MNPVEPGGERPGVFIPRHAAFTATTVIDPASATSVPAAVFPTDRTISGEFSSPTEAPSDTPDLAGLIRALRRRWKLAVLGGLLSASLTAVAVYLLLPASKYTTSALVFVAANRPREIFETRETSAVYAT